MAAPTPIPALAPGVRPELEDWDVGSWDEDVDWIADVDRVDVVSEVDGVVEVDMVLLLLGADDRGEEIAEEDSVADVAVGGRADRECVLVGDWVVEGGSDVLANESGTTAGWPVTTPSEFVWSSKVVSEFEKVELVIAESSDITCLRSSTSATAQYMLT